MSAYTNTDALGYYLSGTPGGTGAHADASSLGGVRLATEVWPYEVIVDFPIPPIVICQVSPENGTGTGYIRATGPNALAYTAPGDTEGAAVTVAANTYALLESDNGASVRVYRDSVYASQDLGGRMSLEFVPRLNNALSMDNVPNADRVSGEDYYRAIVLHNHSDAAITLLKAWVPLMGTAQVSDAGNLSATGSGTIETTGSFADWPAAGWAHVKTDVPATREIVYYTSRTDTVLTVPAAGRELLGTTAAEGAATDTVEPVPGFRFGLETPDSNGEVQTIADETTAPSGITWNTGTTAATGLAVASLAAGESRVLWIHRQIPAGATVDALAETGVNIEFVYGGETYNHNVRAWYRVANSDLALYELYIGVDAAPDFTAAPAATSATLPFSEAITPPGSGTNVLNYATRYVNQYGLSSFNEWAQSIEIDDNGDLVGSDVSAPINVTIESMAGGEVDITSQYPSANDDDPADTWLYYLTTDGVDPDPDVDTPTEVLMTVQHLATPMRTYRHTFGPYAYGTTVKVIVRAKRSSDSVESDNVAVTSHVVTTQNPVRVNWPSVATPGGFGMKRTPHVDMTTYYDGPANTCYLRHLPGETVLYVNTTEIAFRAVAANDAALRFDESWDLVNTAHSASGAATPIEVVSATEIYINVNGTRRCKIDATNDQIEAAEFEFLGVLESLPVIGPIHTTSTATYIQIFNAITGRWQPCLKVDSDGKVTAQADVIQKLG
jgi:hypothetical protein